MEELSLNEAHVMAAIEVVGEATARATGRHPEWVKRRMREALEAIAAAHLGDQPAADGGSELDWAMRHIARLRGMARAALAGKDEG